MLKTRKRGFVVVTLLVLAVVFLIGAYWFSIIRSPGEQLSRDHIRSVIAQESPVLYRDGDTRIGVFFAREHRTYVPFDDIPRSWISAIIAAEDQRFWDHGGVDFRGIGRAMWSNLQAGRMVAGGSTLTQQTAKNLYYRPDRSFNSKWTELLNALRLESLYSKEEILEFYANQFHVSSNGRGLGVASRYFFDKDVSQLTTLESAFLAGMVKAPARYNPFIGTTAEARSEARERARVRTRYVLTRMKAEGVLTASVYQELLAQEIPFKKGHFQYESNVVLDEVEARLSQAPFPALFESLNIDNPSTAGISIVTTLDAEAQRGAQYGLWHHLTEVGAILEGATAEDFSLGPEAKLRFDPGRTTRARTFHRGRAVAGEPLRLQLPNGECLLDDQAVERIADVLARSSSGNFWARGNDTHDTAVRDLVRKGESMLVSIRPGTQDALVCDLEFRPELQGAVMLLESGRVRAMVGGNDNRNFNRAVDARRQLGSIWKPVLYNAAFQLGWAPTDVVDNRSNVFHFEGTWYYPRADHDNVDWTSLAWLGPRSENLGSIWLLMHLTDRLGPRQFRLLADSVGLTRGPGEEWMAYIRRIRDVEGVISTESRLNGLAFTAAKHELLIELGETSAKGRELRSLFYGWGLEAEQERVRNSGNRVEERLQSLHRSYRSLAKMGTPCIPQANDLEASIEQGRLALEAEPIAFGWTDDSIPERPDMSMYADLRVDPETGGVRCGGDGAELTDADWSDWVRGFREPPVASDVVVGDALTLGTLSRLHAIMKRRMLVWGSADPYDWSILQYHPDMRTLVGLRYMDKLARTYGVREPLPPVLSMPLGAVDVSLEEAATLYQGLMDGQTWSFPGEAQGVTVASPTHPTQLIAEIRDSEGAVLYQARPVPRPRAEPSSGRLVGDILRNVVLWGTGRRAASAVNRRGQRVPLAGKTGTTNGYRNAAFAGFVPIFGQGGWSWSSGYTLVAYVGNDDNTPMRRRSVRLQGSNGALPVWIETARSLAEVGLLGDPTPDAESELTVGTQYYGVPVSAETGLRMDDADAEEQPWVLVEGEGTPKRRFTPVGLSDPVSADLEVIGQPVVSPDSQNQGDASQLDTALFEP